MDGIHGEPHKAWKDGQGGGEGHTTDAGGQESMLSWGQDRL